LIVPSELSRLKVPELNESISDSFKYVLEQKGLLLFFELTALKLSEFDAERWALLDC